MSVYYPTCSLCGHHTSAVVAGQCTVFVPLPPEADRLADYCNCRCLRDPVVWEFAGKPELDDDGKPVFRWFGTGDEK